MLASFRAAGRGINGNDPGFSELRDQELRESSERAAAKEREFKERESKLRGRIEEPQAQPPTDDDFAGVFGNWINEVERIDVLLRAAEQRFSHALREIERHIFGFGRLLRDDLDRLIDREVVNGPRPHQETRVVPERAPRFLR